MAAAANETNSATNGVNGGAHNVISEETITRHMTHEEKHAAKQAARFGYGPLARVGQNNSGMVPAFGGEFQPGMFRSVSERKFANPAPLGLSAFALTTFLLSLINLNARDVGVTNNYVVIGPAFAYGGLVQLLAGMWEMAVGNTFGATALSSFGGFWIGTAIILTPGGFDIVDRYTSGTEFQYAFGFYLLGWFIFTTVLLIATLRSTVAFFFLFFTLDLAFLTLGVGYLYGPQPQLITAGGVFGILAAFAAWYNALAGILDDTNSFFVIPVAHFPWSAKARQDRLNDGSKDETNVG